MTAMQQHRLPSISLCLHDAGRELSPAANRLKEILIDTLMPNLARIPHTDIAIRTKPPEWQPRLVVSQKKP
jgi:hypothetical protein